ncbi:MAG: hypothetical protein H8D45_22020 [Bacteroidetes bacterium]|nr:hypothetical protein [Bacteroidota bacterium]MBL7103289.1 hypothetical protein [Bacteroidales bacterium]
MANDKFETYFAEKLWEMIPAIYRHEDGLDTNPNMGVLRSFVLLFAEQAAILRRSHDRLWGDQFIDLCCDWAVPYIADLVGTRLVSAKNKRGRRIDVAKTIYYRRRKGTLRVLEELISDITGWEGVVVEKFKRLGRSRHGLDPFPSSLSGMHTKTLPGGWADIRQQQGSELTLSPFDEFYYTADVRQQNGTDGLFGIPKLAFYLYKLQSFRVEDVEPFDLGDGLKYGFDPSGRDIPLFARRNRPDDWDEWRSAYEWELPLPIRCRLLGHTEYLITESHIQKLNSGPGLSTGAINDLRSMSNVHFYTECRLKLTLQTLSNYNEIKNPAILLPLLGYSIIDKCGKKTLLPDYFQATGSKASNDYSIAVEDITSSEIFSSDKIVPGNLKNWTNNAPDEKKIIIDPEYGRLLFTDNESGREVSVSYHYGFSGNVGAGTYDRQDILEIESNSSIIVGGKGMSFFDIKNNGITQINDNKTYWPTCNKNKIVNMTFQAANQKRPYIRLDDPWIMGSGVNKDSNLCIDGLWFGSTGSQELIIQGDFECVVIKHCTLDPGGDIDMEGNIIHPLPLVIEGNIETLILDSSITAPIFCRNGGLVENLKIYDSIIQSVDAEFALQINNGSVEMNRVTVFGAIEVLRLFASETILTNSSKVSKVKDTQNSCFCFSAAPIDSRLPKPYESYLYSGDTNFWFTSKKFGQPGFAQILDISPVEIRRGAENGSEMGAFSSLINPIKMDSLRAKVEEYMPFGLIHLFINKT